MHVAERGGRYCVVGADGEPIAGGCHAQPADAEAHRRAIAVSEGKSETPGGLPELAGRIWRSMYDSALREWRGTDDQKRQVAEAAAWSAVRAKFLQNEDGTWEERPSLSLETLSAPIRSSFTREIGCKFITDATSWKRGVTFSEVYVPWEVDAHGDFTNEPEIEAAAYKFARSNLNQIGLQHRAWRNKGYPVETFLSRSGDADFQVPGSWIMGIQWSPDMQRRIKAGEVTGLSLGGDWTRVPIIVGGVNGFRTRRVAKAEEVTPRATALNFIKDIDVGEVSGVDRPATRKRFRFFKEERPMPNKAQTIAFDECVAQIDKAAGAGMGLPICSLCQAKYPADGGGISLPDGVTLEQAASELAQVGADAGLLPEPTPPPAQGMSEFQKMLDRALSPIKAVLGLGPCPEKKAGAKDALGDCVATEMASAHMLSAYPDEQQRLAVAYTKCGEGKAATKAAEEEPMTTLEREEFNALKEQVGKMVGTLEGIATSLKPATPAADPSPTPTTVPAAAAPAAAPATPEPVAAGKDESYVPENMAAVGADLVEIATAVEGIKQLLEEIVGPEELQPEPVAAGKSRQILEPEPASGGKSVGEEEEDGTVFSSIVGAPIAAASRRAIWDKADKRLDEKYGDRRGTKRQTSGLGMRVRSRNGTR